MEHNAQFKEKVDQIYKSITENSIVLYDFKDALSLLNEYEYLMNENEKKKKGSFYTDRFIIRYILENVLSDADIINNPFIRIFDPSCGLGYFLLEAYDMLKQIYSNRLDDINRMHPELCLKQENIHVHILKYNIFGADIDKYAVKLAVISLMLKDKESFVIPNIICCDSLINWEDTFFDESSFFKEGFDIIIGNPPYIGHKMINGEYRKNLNNIYGDIFKDKADISFCFIKSSIDRLKQSGKLCFITSRYFIESLNGKALRKYIKENSLIKKIVDFYGIRIMKGISVDPLIIMLEKERMCSDNNIEILRAEKLIKKNKPDNNFFGFEKENDLTFKSFIVRQEALKDEGWVFLNDREASIIERIECSLKTRLSDLCESYQGIITGCDKAFILNAEDIEKYNIEKEIIRPWIKNSDIYKYKVSKSTRFIIYSDFIAIPEKYRNSIAYIEMYKNKLEKRRECKNGLRKWYQLQWGRDSTIFEGRKIIFPYKSSSNRFAMDEGNYCSADVYCMLLKNPSSISYEFLLGILNSRLYEFYFKSFAKKLGDDLYDYYPNTVMRLFVPSEDDDFITDNVKKILKSCDEVFIKKCMDEIDKRIYSMFLIRDEDIDLIERRYK